MAQAKSHLLSMPPLDSGGGTSRGLTAVAACLLGPLTRPLLRPLLLPLFRPLLLPPSPRPVLPPYLDEDDDEDDDDVPELDGYDDTADEYVDEYAGEEEEDDPFDFDGEYLELLRSEVDRRDMMMTLLYRLCWGLRVRSLLRSLLLSSRCAQQQMVFECSRRIKI